MTTTTTETINYLWDQVCESGLLNKEEELTYASITTTQKCDYCKSDNIDLISSDKVCFNCGTILDKNWNTNASSDWGETYGNGKTIGRCNIQTNETFYDMGMATKAKSNANLRQHQKRSNASYRVKKLYTMHNFLDQKATEHNIPKDVIQTTKNIYNQVSEEYFTKKQNTYALLAGCIYLGYKQNNYNITVKDVAHYMDINQNTITKNYKKISSITQENNKPITSIDFVYEHCEILSISSDVIDVVKTVATLAEEYNLTKSNPHNVSAGSIIWVLKNNNTTQIKSDDYIHELGLQKHSVENVVKELHKYKTFLNTKIHEKLN